MPGNVTFDPYPTPLSDFAVPVIVCRFDRTAAAGERYMVLPNVRCRSIAFSEGHQPPTARLEYILDDVDPDSPYPQKFDDVWPLSAQGPWVVKNEDELVIFGITSAGIDRIMFAGFARIPQVDLAGESQSATFVAIGTPIRCWDLPIAGRFQRNADVPDSTSTDDTVYTELPTKFNPSVNGVQMPNATPKTKDIDDGTAGGYPLFLDEAIVRDPDPRRKWTVGMAVRYLLTFANEQGEVHEYRKEDEEGVKGSTFQLVTWVKNPDFTELDVKVQARLPKAGAQFYDPGDPATYDAKDVEVRDYDCTNKCWPDAVAELLGFAGCAMRFVLSQDSDDEPVWTLEIYRKDASGPPPLDVYLQAAGPLDVGRTNVAELHLARDVQALVNEIEIDTDPYQVEASFVLAPGYTPAAGDEADGTRDQYLGSALDAATSAVRDKYRKYVYDEAGDGHFDAAGGSFVTASVGLDDVLGEPDEDGPTYVHRLRPGKRTLLSKDPAKKALKAVLCLSRDYAGPVPGVWDGTGHWQPIEGSWELLKDRLGINVTAENPEAWDIGKYKGADPQNPGRTLRGITSQAAPSGTDQNTKRFTLMLTTVIDSDLAIGAVALRRDASPSRYTISRRIDCRDHFKKQVVAPNSWYNRTAKPVTALDQQAQALAHAAALRAAHEFPPLAGAIAIPWLTNAYRVGRRIRRIVGRDVSLQSNAGTQAAEAPHHPYITLVEWDFSGQRQVTTLRYGDRAAEPQGA